MTPSSGQTDEFPVIPFFTIGIVASVFLISKPLWGLFLLRLIGKLFSRLTLDHFSSVPQKRRALRSLKAILLRLKINVH